MADVAFGRPSVDYELHAQKSDHGAHAAVPTTDLKIVMAEQSVHDVVNQTRSVGDASLADDLATRPNHIHAPGDAEESGKPPSQVSAVSEAHVRPSPDNPAASTTPLTNGTPNEGKLTDLSALMVSLGGPQDRSKSPSMPNGDPSSAVEAKRTHEQIAAADLSGGSDTDTTRHDALDGAEKDETDGSRHVRSNSLKKPATFKAVSVTKNFLAKAAAGAIPASKLGDKVVGALTGQTGGANQPPPRPRLVAKTGSGLRDAAPRAPNNSPGSGRSAGPDPSQVWNKNRPTQPAPPKQFTDEELKQQYGIHLATRLQADEAGKEAKWADIDDDDDDWAPETIEWNDGTKITLPQPDEPSAAPASHQSQLTAPAGLEEAPAQPSDSVIPRTSSPAKAAPSAGNAIRTGGLVLKGAPEKPVLVAKPPVPQQVKSPWAPLPPVERVSPVVGSPPQSQATPRFAPKMASGSEGMQSPQAATTEIAADDFNRSWRDTYSGASRELYNSQSGRYEPVNEARRGSLRADPHHRQPAVLQRPSATDSKGPAEPSPAFQTHRAGGQDEPWGRRRTSSSISGGSGHLGRRLSMSKGHDMGPPPHHAMLGQRRGSQQAGGSEHADSNHHPSPTSNASSLANGVHPMGPGHGTHPGWHSQASPGSPHAALASHPDGGASPGPGLPNGQVAPPMEDPIQMQKKIMRESRELAMKRRKEQEDREEAERKERIRVKMEALGMLPPGEKDGKEAKPKEVLSKPTTSPDSESTSAPSKDAVTNAASPATDPATTGTSKRHESVKVYQAKPARKPMAGEARPLDGDADGPAPSEVAPLNPSMSNSHRPAGAPGLPGRVEDDVSMKGLPDHVPSSTATKPQEQPWKHVPAGSDTYTSWGGASMTTHSAPGGNLWGPPSNDKALGNGTFDRGYGRLPSRTVTQPGSRQAAPGPGPIGPPTAVTRSGGPSPPDAETRLPLTGDGPHGSSVAPTTGRTEPAVPSHLALPPDVASRPGPIGRPVAPSASVEPRRVGAASAWKALPAQLAQQDAEEATRSKKQYALRMEEQAAGIARETSLPSFRDTWRQVIVDDNIAGPRQIKAVSTTVASPDPAAPAAPSTPTSSGVATAPAPSGSVRGSRFFPHPIGSAPPAAVKLPAMPGHAETHFGPNPPPDSVEHPVYDGDIKRPQVLLPSPKPVVKLPPATVGRAKVELPAMTESARPTPPVHDPSFSWQDRINGLFHSKKPTAPPKPQTGAISSISRAPLETAAARSSATVSLPREDEAARGWSKDGSLEVTTRATEEALLEEREFGSLPIVRIPTLAPPNAWQPAKAPSTPRHRTKFQRPMQVLSVEPFTFKAKESSQGTVIEVLLPGTTTGKSLTQPRIKAAPRPPRTSSSPRGKDKRRVGKSREASGSFGTPRSTPGGAVRASFNSANWARRVQGTAH
ncbi:MAG: hypothetical protein M1838_001791 [Thelocarpon superellum]|nr:MAG: hypothetical protein M1838_001791 [Thelocarpon superellum]